MILPVLLSLVYKGLYSFCLLYTSDAADEEDSVDLGGRRFLKKKKNEKKKKKNNTTRVEKKSVAENK